MAAKGNGRIQTAKLRERRDYFEDRRFDVPGFHRRTMVAIVITVSLVSAAAADLVDMVSGKSGATTTGDRASRKRKLDGLFRRRTNRKSGLPGFERFVGGWRCEAGVPGRLPASPRKRARRAAFTVKLACKHEE